MPGISFSTRRKSGLLFFALPSVSTDNVTLFQVRYFTDPAFFKQNVQFKLKCPKKRALLGKTVSCVEERVQQLVMVTVS